MFPHFGEKKKTLKYVVEGLIMLEC